MSQRSDTSGISTRKELIITIADVLLMRVRSLKATPAPGTDYATVREVLGKLRSVRVL